MRVTLEGILNKRILAQCYSLWDRLGHVTIRNREALNMPVDAELLEILACPNCKTPVTLVKDGQALKCDQCHRVYPIKDDIPVMLVDEATIEA